MDYWVLIGVMGEVGQLLTASNSDLQQIFFSGYFVYKLLRKQGERERRREEKRQKRLERQEKKKAK